jgi:hypothetical protein
MTKFSTDNVEHSLHSFLARPAPCPGGEITWTNASAANVDLMTMNIPSGIFSSTPMFAEKVSGFYGFRGTMVIKIQTNAQKFQTGILLVSVVPCSGHITNSRISVIKNLTLKSQLPSVRMNVAETDEVEIRIPFTSPELFYNFSAPIDWARVCDCL